MATVTRNYHREIVDERDELRKQLQKEFVFNAALQAQLNDLRHELQAQLNDLRHELTEAHIEIHRLRLAKQCRHSLAREAEIERLRTTIEEALGALIFAESNNLSVDI